MNQSISPDPEFTTPEEAEAYDKWFREQVELALTDPGPRLPHEQAVQKIRAMIEERRKRRRTQQS